MKRNLLPVTLLSLSLATVTSEAKAATVTPVIFSQTDQLSVTANFQINAHFGGPNILGIPPSPIPLQSPSDNPAGAIGQAFPGDTAGFNDVFADFLFFPSQSDQNTNTINTTTNLVVNNSATAPFDARPGDISRTGLFPAVTFTNGIGGFNELFGGGAFSSTVRSFDGFPELGGRFFPTKASGIPFITAQSATNSYFFYLETANVTASAAGPTFIQVTGTGIVGACVTDNVNCGITADGTPLNPNIIHELDLWTYTFVDDVPGFAELVTGTGVFQPQTFSADFTLVQRLKPVPEPTSLIATAIAIGAGFLTTRRKQA